ncbi:MAG: hypothetical protein ACOC8F_06630 [Planctomycetota bacterium]
MRQILALSLIACGLVALAGCWQTEHVMTLNPDGSGKVAFQIVTAVPVNPMGASQGKIADPEQAARRAVEKMLADADGVEAWSDVAYAIREDGRIRLSGTAYFADYAELELPGGKMPITWEEDDGGMVLSLDIQPPEMGGPVSINPADAPPAGGEDLDGEELDQAILAQRMQYQQARPLMVAMLTSMTSEVTFRLPGELAEHSGFTKTDAGLNVAWEGKTLLKAMDATMADKNKVAELVREGGAAGQSVMAEEIRQAVLGTDEPLRARVTGDLKPTFDYAAELENAKENQKAMLEKLGIDPERPAGGPEGFMPGSQP